MGFSTERSAHNKVRRKKDKTEQKVKVRKQRTTYKTKNTARRKSEGLNKLNWFVNFHSPSEDAMDQYMQDKQNEIPEKEVIFKPFHFLPVFQDFSVPEYCKYSRTARNIVRFTTDMNISAKGCGPVTGISQASITDALISPTTPAKLTRLYFFGRNLNGR